MSRTEYYDDPNAPAPTAIVAAASAVVVNGEHKILLQRRKDNDLWSLPGGAMEIGESIAQTVLREVREESGLYVELVRLVGIYTDPRHVIAYSNGEVRQQFSICFACRVIGGELRRGDESTEVGFFAPDELKGLPIQPSIQIRLQHFFEDRSQPVIA
ncbi:MAG: NUDIX domain-containing protein [Candidatus Dormibacteraeota bacterium]|nr:NUDIX domain-containing protein [Candidatus Dormibacteraeota bacterium]